MNREATHLLLESSGSDFFERLEEHLHTKIPVLIKNILLVMDIDRALLLATFDNDSITHIEQYMKSEFLKETKSENEQVKDYLGKFGSCQDKFTFSYGHKLMMNVMADACRNIVKPTLSAQNNTNSNIAAATVQKELATSLTQEDALELKEQLLDALLMSLRVWIQTPSALSQIRSHGELRFKIVKDSYKWMDDGTITCEVGCPVPNCKKDIRVSYKSYKSSYKPKKKSAENQRRLPPKWHIFTLEYHMISCHHDVTDDPRSTPLPSSSNQLPTNSSQQGTSTLTDYEANETIDDLPANLSQVSHTTKNEQRITDTIEQVGSQSINTRIRKKRVVPNFSNYVGTKRKKI